MGNVPVYVVDLSSFYFLSHPLTIQWMTAISICHLNSGKLIASGLPPFATNFLLNDKTRKKNIFSFQFQTSSRIITLKDKALFKHKDVLMYGYVSESPMNWCNMKL